MAVDELGRDAHRLEDLRTAVGRDGGDPHLREGLQETLTDPLDRPPLGLLSGHPVRQRTELDELAYGLEHQIRVDGGGTVADQGGDAVDASRLARLDDEAGLETCPLAHQMVVGSGDREQRRQRCAVLTDGAVGEDQDVCAGGERYVGLVAQPLERSSHPGRPFADGPGDVECARLEDRRMHLPQLLELGIEQDRGLQYELPRVLRRLVEEVLLRPDARLEAHHDRLPDRVDRRIRDLGEQLLEVGIEKSVAIREDGEGCVVPHRADGLLGVPRQRREDHLHVFLRVAEGNLALAQRLGRCSVRLPLGQVGEANHLALEPFAVRLLGGNPALDLVVGDDPPLLEIDEEELPGLQAPFAEDVLGRNIEHAGLRGEHDPAVTRLEPASRPQAVAVECRANHAAIRERHGGGPIPRLHQALVVGIEAQQLGWEIDPAGRRLGDHHHHRVRQRAATQDEQFEHVVERPGIRPSRLDDREHLVEVVTEQLRGELRLAGAHPVDVAAHRVDLAVVGDHPVRVRELPARERVRRESRMDESEGTLGALVLQVRVVPAELRRGEHALVHDRARREARDARVGTPLELEAAADHIELPFERVLVVDGGAPGRDDELADERGRRCSGAANMRRVDGNVAPTHDALALRLDERRQEVLELRSTLRLLGKKAHRDAVAARRGKRLSHLVAEERVRKLDQDARPVARIRVGPRGAAVLQVLERLERPPHGLVQRNPVEPGDERDPARVVLVVGGVETGFTSARGAHRTSPPKGWDIAGLEIRRSTHTISPRLAVSSAGANGSHDFKE